MKNRISGFIKIFVDNYQNRESIGTKYGEPLVGFADAFHPNIQSLPGLIPPSHELPQSILPDAPPEHEYCLFRSTGACGVCVKNCPAGALTKESYDRFRCYALCRENAGLYTEFGSSYANEDGSGANSIGSEVCGKCITGSPCAFKGF